MPLLCYTTQVEVSKTIGEITAVLIRSGVQAIGQEFDKAGNIIGIHFQVTTPRGKLAYKLPANVPATAAVMNRQADARMIPKAFKNDIPQARRVAWRCIRQWIEAQMALVEIGCASLDQVMLPYVVTSNGETLYERYVIEGLNGLMLNAPKEEVEVQ